jgi:hypothetical protein
MTVSKKTEKKAVVTFKVALAGRENIWRRIALRGEDTLDDLHNMIFDAFDRYDEHLYSFYFPKTPPKGTSRAWIHDAKEYTHSYTLEDGPFGSNAENAAKTKIGLLGLKKDQKFYYLFDFGDEWWHEITVEATDVPAEKGKYPRVLEKKGKSPPQYPDDEEEYEEEEDED